MEITQYISDLLFEHDCVVIPGLGAFVANYKPAQVDETRNAISPPSKEIAFNQKLKNDDGILVNCIAAAKKIPEFEAVKRVEEFRENIQYRLEKGETVEFSGLGILKLDDDNQIVFDPHLDKNYLLDSYGLEKTAYNPEGAGKKEVPVPKKKKSFAWMFFLLIPIAAGAVFIYLNISQKAEDPENYSLQKRLQDEEHPKIEKSAEIQEDTLPENLVPADTVVVDSFKAEPLKQETVEKPTGEIRYYLIGGNFQEKENADKYFSKVKNLGFEPMDLGKQGSFYVVAVGGYPSMKEASIAKEEYNKKDPNTGVYIIKVD